MADSTGYFGLSGADIFLAKLDTSSGSIISVRQIGGDNRDRIQWMETDHKDNLWIGGTTSSKNLEIAQGISIDRSRFFLAKFDSQDSLRALFTASLGEDYLFFPNNELSSASITENGNVHVTFISSDSFSISGQPIFTDGGHIWLSIDTNGEFKFFKDLSTTPALLATGPENSIFLAGSFRGKVMLDSVELDGGMRRNYFTASLDSLGNVQWIDYWPTGSTFFARVNQIQVANQKVYWVGDWEFPLFPSNGDTIVSAGQTDGVITRYDMNGELDWIKGVGGNSDNFLNKIALHESGSIYTVGSFYSFITLADTIIIGNTFGGLDRFEYWIGKLQDSTFSTSLMPSMSASAIKVYPNPFEDQIFLQNLQPGDYRIQLFDAQGREIHNASKLIRSASEIYELRMSSSMSLGVYYLLVTNHLGQRFSINLLNQGKP